MKAAILVCVMAATALAAPRYNRTTKLDTKLSEHVRVAEQAWITAESEPDGAKQPALWELAAGAFAEIDSDPVDVKIKREAAYASVLAWKNSLAVDVRVRPPSPTPDDKPAKVQPLPARELKFIAALDRYLKYVDPKDAELPGLVFLKAQTYARFGHIETALPIFRTIVDRYRQHEVAEYAANLILDAYNRLQQYDQLVGFAEELSKDATFMRDRKDLAATVAKILHQSKRKRIEHLEAAAYAAKDLEKYTAVGTAYLELYNADPQGPEGDVLLYNAGVAFETGRAIGSATQAFTLLQRYYPRSKQAARSLARLGRLYASVAMYDRAAEKLEEYAAKYAGEKDAFDAMSDAVYYRRALGDRDKAIADTKYFIKVFGMKRPREAADAMWSLTTLYEADPEQSIVHLRDYLRRYGTKGDAGRVVIAHTKIGQLLWKQSCSIPGVDGLCVKANESAPRTCGTGTTRTLAAIARQPNKVKEALVELAHAISEFERQRTNDDSAARYYYAQAKLIIGDAKLEPYLALEFPRGLNFDPANTATRSASMKRFTEWLAQKQKAGAKLTSEYEAVLSIRDAASSITAAARLGIITQSYASALVTGEIPRDVRVGALAADKVAAYCDTLTDVAEPLEAAAVNAFGVCLSKSTELGWFHDSSVQCERELTRMRPAEFPRMTEIRIQPLLDAPVIDVEPPLR